MVKCSLSPTQVRVLKTLVANPSGLTRVEIEKTIDCNVGTDIIGPVYDEDRDRYPDSLYTMGYVYPMWDEDIQNAKWTVTSYGKKMASKIVTRSLTSAVVPGNVLDPVVIAFRPTRTYGIELYSAQDLQEIRSKLGEPYKDVPIDDLRQQIVNRRKMGKYTTKETIPEWYTIYRSGQHWTALVSEITEHNGCAVNNTHTEGINVYHRRFRRAGESVINREAEKDLIVLCASCRKKLNGNLPAIPDTIACHPQPTR